MCSSDLVVLGSGMLVEVSVAACTFFIPQGPNTWLMHFVIILDLELYMKVCVLVEFSMSRFTSLSYTSGGENFLLRTRSRGWSIFRGDF